MKRGAVAPGDGDQCDHGSVACAPLVGACEADDLLDGLGADMPVVVDHAGDIGGKGRGIEGGAGNSALAEGLDESGVVADDAVELAGVIRREVWKSPPKV